MRKGLLWSGTLFLALSQGRGDRSRRARGRRPCVCWIVQQGGVLRPLPGSAFSFARLTGGVAALDPRLASVTPAGVGARNGRWSVEGALLFWLESDGRSRSTVAPEQQHCCSGWKATGGRALRSRPNNRPATRGGAPGYRIAAPLGLEGGRPWLAIESWVGGVRTAVLAGARRAVTLYGRARTTVAHGFSLVTLATRRQAAMCLLDCTAGPGSATPAGVGVLFRAPYRGCRPDCIGTRPPASFCDPLPGSVQSTALKS